MQTEDNKEFPAEAMTKEELENEVFSLRQDLKEYQRIWEKVSLILMQSPSNPADVFSAARLAMAGMQQRNYDDEISKAADRFPNIAELHVSLDLALLRELERYESNMRQLLEETKIAESALLVVPKAKNVPLVNLREKWEKFCKKVSNWG